MKTTITVRIERKAEQQRTSRKMQVKLAIKVIFTWFIIQEECKLFENPNYLCYGCSIICIWHYSTAEYSTLYYIALHYITFIGVFWRYSLGAQQFIHHINTCKHRTHIVTSLRLTTSIQAYILESKCMTKSQFICEFVRFCFHLVARL